MDSFFKIMPILLHMKAILLGSCYVKLLLQGATVRNSQRGDKSAYCYRSWLQSAYSFQWESLMFTD